MTFSLLGEALSSEDSEESAGAKLRELTEPKSFSASDLQERNALPGMVGGQWLEPRRKIVAPRAFGGLCLAFGTCRRPRQELVVGAGEFSGSES